MAAAPVPGDINSIKKVIFFGRTARELLWFFVGSILAIPAFFLIKSSVGVTSAALIAMIVLLPFAFMGIIQKDGLSAERWLIYFIKFMRRNKYRPYKTKNLFTHLDITIKDLQKGNINAKSNTTTKKNSTRSTVSKKDQ